MGIAMLVVGAGYLVLSLLLVTLVAFLFRKAKPNVGLGILGLVILLLAWPVWVILANQAFYRVVCRVGEPGTHINEPFRVDIITRQSYGAHYVPPRWDAGPHFIRGKWEPGPSFVDDCRNGRFARDCAKLFADGDFFSWYREWRAVRDSAIIVEKSWRAGPKGKEVLRHARLWIAELGAPECIAPLSGNYDDSKGKRCIAGREIQERTAAFVLRDLPFVREAHALDASRESPTSMEWRWFGVEKHQHHLLKGGKVVARYVWYWKNLMPNSAFSSDDTCPENARGAYSPQSGIRDFWALVLSAKGVEPTTTGPLR